MRSWCMHVRPAEVVIKPSGWSTDIWMHVNVELQGLDFFTMVDSGGRKGCLVLSKCCVGWLTRWFVSRGSHWVGCHWLCNQLAIPQNTSNSHLLLVIQWGICTRHACKQTRTKKVLRNSEEMSILACSPLPMTSKVVWHCGRQRWELPWQGNMCCDQTPHNW